MRHSATSLKTWDNCPRLYKAKYIDKVLPFVTHPAAQRGVEIHAKLEEAVATGTAPDVWTPEGLVPALHAAGAEVEVSLGITREGTPCGYADDAVWLRGKIDVLVRKPDKALVCDWKTGKVRPDKIQADMYTALVGGPVEFRLVYVDQRQVVNLSRDAQAWDRIKALAEAVEQDEEYLPNPCWLCRFCDYHACRYNTAPRRQDDDD